MIRTACHGPWAALMTLGLTLALGAQAPQYQQPPAPAWGTAPAQQQWQQPQAAPTGWQPQQQVAPGYVQPWTPPPAQQPANRQISFNAMPLTGQSLMTLQQLEAMHGVTLPDGNYWYDSVSGLWGMWGQGAVGQIPPGLALGGALPPNASGGGNGTLTGVFINGRELHPTEVTHLRQITQVFPGRYWLDAQGNGGYEGQPMTFNIVQLAQQAQSSQGGGQAWSHSTWGPDGYDHVGGDGDGFLYFSGSDGTSVTIENGVPIY